MTDGDNAEQPVQDDDDYADWIGRTIDGRYRIDALLGEGGMGAVFEAEHLKLQKRVALKVIHPEFAGDGEVAERFAREAMASAQLEHPHVATATDYGTLPEGGAYLVMRFVRGRSLRGVLDEQGALEWTQACSIMVQVVDALSSAHKLDIVHRDLKPDNIMLEPRDDGTELVKVLDFGIARVATDSRGRRGGTALTRVGSVVGTPGYMAPEQALGEPVDHRVDLYAVGLLLYELISGEAVYDGGDLTAIVTRQLTEEIAPLSERVEIPAELNALVMQSLRREKDLRPASAGEVRERLRGLLLGATVRSVTHGDTDAPAVSTLELAGLGRADPTPLRVARPERDADEVAPAPELPAAARMKAPPARVFVAVGCAGVFGIAVLASAVAMLGGGPPEVGAKQLEARQVVPPVGMEPTGGEPVSEPSPPNREGLPDAIATDVQRLAARRAGARQRAARRLLAHEPRTELPKFVVELAQLERANGCARKRERLVRLRELGDVRAIPALERLNAQPRNGCRRVFRRIDCYACLRRELATTLETLRAAP